MKIMAIAPLVQLGSETINITIIVSCKDCSWNYCSWNKSDYAYFGLKKLKRSSSRAKSDIRIRSSNDYKRRCSDFYFSCMGNDWLCKICTSFSLGQSCNFIFHDQPRKLRKHSMSSINTSILWFSTSSENTNYLMS